MVNEWPVVAARVPSPKLTASVKQATRRIREGMAGSCISVFVRIIAPRVAKTIIVVGGLEMNNSRVVAILEMDRRVVVAILEMNNSRVVAILEMDRRVVVAILEMNNSRVVAILEMESRVTMPEMHKRI